MQEIVNQWLLFLTDFIIDLQKNGKVRKDVKAKDIASDMLAIYQGYITLWKLTKENRHIDLMEKKFMELAKTVEISH
ncbi:hypothetical protein [Leptospira idonii]|uniref:hypothetical protein n=1 Tax=Leptospira idonii TaxID=1193500 RepID=UPI001AEFFA12|nr:hypothetical protein [Leptospira idonii]